MAGYRKGKETVRKRLLYVNRRPPHGTIYGLEGLEVVLVGAAFDQEVSLLFLDDGVFQLVDQQAPDVLGMKHYAKGFKALELYDVENLYVEAQSLAERGLAADDLLLEAEVTDRATVARIMAEHDVIFTF